MMIKPVRLWLVALCIPLMSSCIVGEMITESAIENAVSPSSKKVTQAAHSKSKSMTIAEQKEREKLMNDGKCPDCRGMGKSPNGMTTCNTCKGTGKYQNE
jgi:DnaJ-class molecular chaperone